MVSFVIFSMLQCEYCGKEFKITFSLIKKVCPCDEEFRFMSFDEWYLNLFKIDWRAAS